VLTPLRVQLLGGFRLTSGETPVQAVDSAAQQTLLSILVLHRDAPRPRQQVAFHLWPDSPEAQAQANLRTLLVRLRRGWPDFDRFVETTPRTISWRPEAAFSLDVADFEEAVRQAEALIRSDADAQTARANLEVAVHLYRGDLLPGCYDDWILPERERLRQLFLGAIRNLIQLLERQRDFTAAIRHAHALLQLDPLEETSYHQLMRLHALRGDRASLVRIFDTCATVLQRELSVEPSLTTRGIYESLLRLDARAAPVEVQTRSANHNLPYALTSFIGRDREIAELRRLLRPPTVAEPATPAFGVRLLTLTGAGGSGKTRLALQVALDVWAQYADGAWWVDLAPLTDPWIVSRTVASILGVQEQTDRALIETLASAVGVRRLLLILDNCEHLVAECATLASHLLSACPNLTILATSQESLGVAGEAIYPTPLLSLPLTPEVAGVDRAEAVQLFVERAALALPTFTLTPHNRAAVVQICRRLDGIPLAIELAAARVNVLSVRQIAARLDDRFGLLTSSDRAALHRHQTLRAMVDWSYGLLSAPEQTLFRKLAVFTGGFTLEAAEAVAGSPDDPAPSVLRALSRLIDKSLVIAETAAGEVARFRMLETIHQYARERLKAAEAVPDLRQRHAAYYSGWAAEIGPQLQTAKHKEWMWAVEAEQANLEAALEWWLTSSQTEAALRLVNALGWYWIARSAYSEGRQALERCLTLPDASQYPVAYGRALAFNGMIAFMQTEASEAKPWLERAVAVARVQGDHLTLADALDVLGLVLMWQKDLPKARACLEESQRLFQAEMDQHGCARLVWHLGLVLEREGDVAAALEHYEKSLALFRELEDPLRVSVVLRSLGWNYYERGDVQRGQQAYREMLEHAQGFGNRAEIAHSLRAVAERIEVDPARAVRLLMVVLNLYRKLGSTTYEKAVLEKDVAQRRAQLDEQSFMEACDAGRAWTWEQAVQEALADL
jgi:predicted ATPase/DNA-binding SARP family transcriptional activator